LNFDWRLAWQIAFAMVFIGHPSPNKALYLILYSLFRFILINVSSFSRRLTGVRLLSDWRPGCPKIGATAWINLYRRAQLAAK
jgi:hypothetical protein